MKIESAELRQAMLITELLKRKSAYKTDLLRIYLGQGKAAAHEYSNKVDSPEKIFNALPDRQAKVKRKMLYELY